MNLKLIPWKDVIGYGIPLLLVIVGAVWAVPSRMSTGEAIFVVLVLVLCTSFATVGIMRGVRKRIASW